MNDLFVMTMWAANTAHIVFSARLAPVMRKVRQGLVPITLVLIGFAPFSQAHSMPGVVLGGTAAREESRRPEIFRDGVSLAHGGAWLKPRDLARIGQLMLQRGAFGGRQVVPAAWVDDCTTAHANLSHGPYGYQWWVVPDLGGFVAHGRGGQMLYVIPRQRLVVVHTADADAEWPVTVYSEDVEALIYQLIRGS